jgi:predicted transglutaminase-like cysteine proteinase
VRPPRCDNPKLRAGARSLRRCARVGLAVLLALLTALVAQAADDAVMQRRAAAMGPQAESGLHQLRLQLQHSRSLDPAAQLRAINQFFNRYIEFATDEQAWGQVDYWASPLESLHRRRGDCEDYAIAKYFSLLAVGMPVARLRLVYVRAQLDDGPAQAHMVLAYYPGAGGETLILDNLVDEVLPASQRRDLVPVFSFNSDGLWQGVGTVGAGDPLLRLTRWRELLAKVRAEGFL